MEKANDTDKTRTDNVSKNILSFLFTLSNIS